MRFPFHLILLFLACIIQTLYAAPASSLDSSSSSVVTSPPHITSTHSPSSSVRRVRPTSASRTHPFIPPTEPIITQPHHTFNPNHTPPADALPPPPPFRPHPHPHPHHSGQKPIVIVFEVLGGALALAFLLGFLRCCYKYQRTPKRDRIAAVLSRHQLERELAELERNPTALRRRSFIVDPAPPYFPPPPAYVTQATTNTANNSAIQYIDIPTSSPPITPPSPTRPLDQPSASSSRPVALPPNG